MIAKGFPPGALSLLRYPRGPFLPHCSWADYPEGPLRAVRSKAARPLSSMSQWPILTSATLHHQTLDAKPQQLNMEVDWEPHSHVCEPQARQELSDVNREQRVCDLQFGD